MATKSKEELLAEAKELNLDVTEENSVAEIKAAIKAASEPAEEASVEEVAGGAGDGREPSIVEEPEESFDQRTQKTVPWQED